MFLSFWRIPPVMRCWLFLAVIPVAVCCVAQSSSDPVDRDHIHEVLRGLNRGRSVSEVAVSPDGKRVAWIEGMR